MLHDQNRNIVLLYNAKTYTIEDASTLTIQTISEEEKYYQNLWNCFYHTIGIKERKNSKLRMNFMPKKYWQDLIEKL